MAKELEKIIGNQTLEEATVAIRNLFDQKLEQDEYVGLVDQEAELISKHHEKWDGNGYPLKKKWVWLLN